jgi:hypothetical protein
MLLIPWYASIICALASTAVHLTRIGSWAWLWRESQLTQFAPELGHAFSARTGRLDLSAHEHESPAQVFENGRALGPSNAQHATIRDVGGGQF